MKDMKLYLLALLAIFGQTLYSQIEPGVYFAENEGVKYEMKLTSHYLIMSSYGTDPAEFHQTFGGFYNVEDGHIKVNLEFNSNYESDSIRMVDIPFHAKDEFIVFRLGEDLRFSKVKSGNQDLDGQWLFATRGPDEGQDRRGESNARKTLKFLMDGRFQWIAYHTETMKFSGTGGGAYTSEDGKYVEKIEYFSRDNSRVGAELGFDYKVNGVDWHHTGKNSKGEDMYEIWSKR